MSTLKEIVRRLEAATGPDRDLDRLIVNALPPRAEVVGLQYSPEELAALDANDWTGVPHYTASLDAAMTLVPDSMGFEIDTFPDGAGEPQNLAVVAAPLDLSVGWSEAATPAIALCIASLKARDHG